MSNNRVGRLARYRTSGSLARPLGRWALSALLLGVGFAACGGKATETGDVARAGASTTVRGGSGSGGSSPGGPSRGGRPQGPGPGGLAGEGVGGRRVPGGPVGQAGDGAAGCGFAQECGGCDQGFVSVVCSWGSVELPWEQVVNELGNEPAAVCKAAQQQYSAPQSAGGASGANEGGAGGEGPILRGLCATYVAPGGAITSCNDGCTETEYTNKVGECTIGGECCVMADVWSCGT